MLSPSPLVTLVSSHRALYFYSRTLLINIHVLQLVSFVYKAKI